MSRKDEVSSNWDRVVTSGHWSSQLQGWRVGQLSLHAFLGPAGSNRSPQYLRGCHSSQASRPNSQAGNILSGQTEGLPKPKSCRIGWRNLAVFRILARRGSAAIRSWLWGWRRRGSWLLQYVVLTSWPLWRALCKRQLKTVLGTPYPQFTHRPEARGPGGPQDRRPPSTSGHVLYRKSIWWFYS